VKAVWEIMFVEVYTVVKNYIKVILIFKDEPVIWIF